MWGKYILLGTISVTQHNSNSSSGTRSCQGRRRRCWSTYWRRDWTGVVAVLEPKWPTCPSDAATSPPPTSSWTTFSSHTSSSCHILTSPRSFSDNILLLAQILVGLDNDRKRIDWEVTNSIFFSGLDVCVFVCSVFLNSDFTYRMDSQSNSQDQEFVVACKRRVIHFVHRWVMTIKAPVFRNTASNQFLQVCVSL